MAATILQLGILFKLPDSG